MCRVRIPVGFVWFISKYPKYSGISLWYAHKFNSLYFWSSFVEPYLFFLFHVSSSSVRESSNICCHFRRILHIILTHVPLFLNIPFLSLNIFLGSGRHLSIYRYQHHNFVNPLRHYTYIGNAWCTWSIGDQFVSHTTIIRYCWRLQIIYFLPLQLRHYISIFFYYIIMEFF